MIKTIVCFLICVILLPIVAAADVPPPGLTMPNKVREALRGIAASYRRGNLAQMMQTHKAARLVESRIIVQSTPAVNVRVPLLLGVYSGSKTNFSRQDFQNQIFDDNPTGTMIDYYREVSYGQFELSGEAYGWLNAPEKQSYYVGDNSGLDGGGSRFTLDVVKLADAETDYSLYDSDDDGYVDVVMIVHPGPGAETQSEGSRNNIWSHSWSLNAAHDSNPSMMPQGEYTTNDPWPGHRGKFIKVNDYIIQPELASPGDSRMIDIGVFCHEFGHALGLPDLYDTDYSSEGIGNWGLMSGGSYGGDGAHPDTPVHPCAWSKEELGWIQPQIIDETQRNVALQNAEEFQQAFYKIPLQESRTGEYFLIENRQKTGYDKYLPSGGLLIWHVDPAIVAHGYGVNNNENRKGVDLEEADGLNDLDFSRNRGDSGDPFPGTSNNHLFNSDTNPNSRSYLGTSGGLAVIVNAENADVVDVDFSLTPVLSVSPTQRFVAYEAGAVNFDVKNLGGGLLRWQAQSLESWLTVENSGSSESGALVVQFEENINTSARTGSILITAEADSSPRMITISQTASGEWRCGLTLSDKGGETATVSFGRLTGASAALDAELGEQEPAPRLTGFFDARFILPDRQMTSLNDFRSPGKEPLEWRLSFQAGVSGFPMTISWDPNNLPTGAYYIKDEFTSTLISVDMKNVDHLTVPTSSIKSLRILCSSQIPQKIAAEKGWNQLSIPYQLENQQPAAVFPEAVSSAFIYDSGYIPATTMETGKSYWLKFNSNRQYSLVGTPVELRSIEVKRGWNMIGPFEQPVAVADIQVSTPDLLSSPFLLHQSQYNSVDVLEPGRGYWVNAAADGQLIFPAPAPSAAGSVLKNFESNISATIAAPAAVEFPLQVSDAAGNSATLWFGLDPQAGNGFDRVVGEEELPPLPPTGAFDTRWVGQNIQMAELGLGGHRDIRRGNESFDGVIVHEVSYQPEKKPVTLSWDLPPYVTGVLASPHFSTINKKMSGKGQLTISLTEAIPSLIMTITYAEQMRPKITVTSPNGGETLRIGSNVEFAWESRNISGDLRMELSRDNGATFTILDIAENFGVWSWKVTPPSSPACLIRISNEYADALDTSDQPFSIQYQDDVKDRQSPPTAFALLPNYPNPFNSSTTMTVQLPEAADVEAALFNSRGMLVRSWALRATAAGNYTLLWDGRDQNGRESASGIYLCRVKAGNHQAVNRLGLLR